MFGVETQLERLSKLGDSLEKINEMIEWEMFREPIVKRIRKVDEGQGGRPPWDEVLMFKVIMLQDWNNLSDPETEYMINDRLTFQRFLGMGEKKRRTKRRYGCSRSRWEKRE
jgi:hypothetical protein